MNAVATTKQQTPKTNNHFQTLLNLSGGIDSVFTLWLYAQHQWPLIVHHCHLINWTERAPHELEAVKSVLAWIGENEPFEFHLIQTQFDYGNMGIVQDKEVIGFLNGVLLRDRRFFLHNIIVCSSRDDISRFGYYLNSESDRMRLIEGVGRRKIKYLYPIANFTKSDMMRRMPRELLDLCWFCRTPKDGQACGKCETCKKVLPVFDKLDNEPGYAIDFNVPLIDAPGTAIGGIPGQEAPPAGLDAGEPVELKAPPNGQKKPGRRASRSKKTGPKT